MLDYKELKNIVQAKGKTFVVPIGGCGEFGLNMTLYIHDGNIYVVDTGLMFPDPAKLGVDAIIANVDPLFAAIGAPTAYLITHGHEDHIGALAQIFGRWPAPVYCTAWTRELIYDRFGRVGLDRPDISTVKAGDQLRLSTLKVDWIHVNHSIPMCCSLLLSFPDIRVYHTGDFKFDDDCPYETPLDAAAVARLCGPEGVDLLLADSTNAGSAGPCPGERRCQEAFEEIFPQEAGDIFVATFSSNLWRLLSIINAAAKSGRKVHFAGAGIARTIEIARLLEMMNVDKQALVDFAGMQHVNHGKRVIVCTGCQGEPLAALPRIIRDEYSGIRMKPEDTVIFSSRMIPGSERAVAYLMSECARRGVRVLTSRTHPKIHVSGHAYQNDLARVMEAVRPKWVLPVHGTFSQLHAHADHAQQILPQSRVFDLEDGVVFSLENNEVIEHGQIDVEWLYIDGFVKRPIDTQNLNKRLKIGELGMVIFSGVYDGRKETWHGEVFLDLKGLVLPTFVDPEEWHQQCKRTASTAVANALVDGIHDAAGINDRVRIAMRQHFNRVFRKKVVVSASVHQL